MFLSVLYLSTFIEIDYLVLFCVYRETMKLMDRQTDRKTEKH